MEPLCSAAVEVMEVVTSSQQTSPSIEKYASSTPLDETQTNLLGGTSKDLTIVDYEDPYVKRNSELQVAFTEVMEDTNRETSSYENVAALLLSWTEDDLGVKAEVDTLEDVFRNVFHYEVHNKCLTTNTRTKPQIQVNQLVANFVADKEGPKTLLIVYYAGHGLPGLEPGHLNLHPDAAPHIVQNELNMVIWNHAEGMLQVSSADVLEIFDCCYAGNLGTRGPSTPLFEYLAATGAGSTTKKAGPKSFTTALIWALKELVKDNAPFTTSQLTNKIKRARDFPQSQCPVLSNRREHPTGLIMLEPFDNNKDPNHPIRPRVNSHRDSGAQEVLNLKFVFDKQLGQEEVKEFGKALGEFCKGYDFPVSRIAWGGLHSGTGALVHEAARKLKELVRRKRHRHSNSDASFGSLGPELTESMPQHLEKQTGNTPGSFILAGTEMVEETIENRTTYSSRTFLANIWTVPASPMTYLLEKGREIYAPSGSISMLGLATLSLAPFLLSRIVMKVYERTRA
ncbi:hypothetical protein MMC18_005090 [Xylographa bjoerkii]|nr:hypothetical protein [Xylographa bjoerkii]